ncbi:MAG: sugar isomerase [Crenarchaeota archaeon]|nr:MAG: sugar isomerase [Thermoproteota archaeon]RDJ34055.1 MAG: sugar isomerase [Thermoproteota archaeon]RDJ36830.1 MAG: sugar isomerase [Thermoproteota archaeon]RDJ37635.1 MAG: sugar isomerase [Thermoproteota archaeon]
MQTIEAYEKDINLQVECLGKFKPCSVIPRNKQSKTIFCGSGDSLAASMLAEAFSEFRVRAMDPLDLLKNPTIPRNNDVCIVSISGRTISNIRVAKLAKHSIGITANPQNKLGKTVSRIIPLKFPNNDVFTAGSISYLESALMCISLVNHFKIKDSKKIFQSAKRQAQRISLGKRVFFLGNLLTYPSAMYAAAKLYEILGYDAYYERIEQFSHMELFSCVPGDTIVIFEKKNPHNSNLAKQLKKIGLNVIHPDPPSANKISQFLFYTFFSQLVPLNLAKKKGQKDCHFVTSKKLRNASDKMIY